MAEMASGERAVVVVADPIDAGALEFLRKSVEVRDVSKEPDKLITSLHEAQGLLVRSRTKVDAKLLESADSLKVVGRAGVGVDNIDVLSAHRKGVVVVNAPGAASTSVAELTLGLIIASARNFGAHLPALKSGSWTKGTNGLELEGRTAGLIGYGRIAREVARRLKALGVNVQAYDPYVSSTNDGTKLVQLDELLKTSDIISIHAALTDSNKHMFNAAAFGKMKKGAILVNVARGPLVDEAALVAALDSGHLHGAALDVFEEEPPHNERLLSHPKVVVVPHIGASTGEAQLRAGMTVAEDIVMVLNGEEPRYPVHV